MSLGAAAMEAHDPRKRIVGGMLGCLHGGAPRTYACVATSASARHMEGNPRETQTGAGGAHERVADPGPRRVPAARRHVLQSPVVLAALAVAGLLAVQDGVFLHPGVAPIIPIDPVLAGRYVGKTVLLGVSELGADDHPLQQQEWVGHIVRLSGDEGIVIEIDGGGGTLWRYAVLPPDLAYLEPAQGGMYELHSTRQVVFDPDFLTTWTSKGNDMAGSGVVPPHWSPGWVVRGYWSSRIYSLFWRVQSAIRSPHA